MKILTIGDTHCRTKYLNEYKIFKKEIIKKAKKNQPDLIVMLGDDLHNHATAHSSQLEEVCDLIFQLSKIAPTYKLIGNHEMVSPSSFLLKDHHFHSMKHIDNVTIVDEPMIVDNLGFCPYVPKGRFSEVDIFQDCDLTFTHQEFRGANMGKVESTSDDVWLKDRKMAICGHIHDRHQVSDNLVYVGSPAQFTFADNEKKYILNIDGFVFDYEEMKDIIKYKTHEIRHDEECDYSKKDRNRVIVSGTLPEIKSFRSGKFFKKLQKDCVAVVPRIEAQEHIEKKDRQSFREIVLDMVSDANLVDVWEEINEA
jgi:DNA repair exonuclease SbcCD nuclease subunit